MGSGASGVSAAIEAALTRAGLAFTGVDAASWHPGPGRDAVIATAREAIDSVGCAVLKGFVRAERLPEIVAECDRTAEFGHRNFNRTNPYFTVDRDDLPPNHPLRRFYDRSNAFVPADNFGADSVLRAIYEWPEFAPFVQAALGEFLIKLVNARAQFAVIQRDLQVLNAHAKQLRVRVVGPVGILRGA